MNNTIKHEQHTWSQPVGVIALARPTVGFSDDNQDLGTPPM